QRQLTSAFAGPFGYEQQRARPFEAGTGRLPELHGPLQLLVITVQTTGRPSEASAYEVVLRAQEQRGGQPIPCVGIARNDGSLHGNGGRVCVIARADQMSLVRDRLHAFGVTAVDGDAGGDEPPERRGNGMTLEMHGDVPPVLERRPFAAKSTHQR